MNPPSEHSRDTQTKPGKRILWLTSWYPNRQDLYSGDFIERHARAASIENDIHVLHVMKKEHSASTERFVTEHIQYKEGARATTIYYQTPNYPIRFLEVIHSNILYLKCHQRFYKSFVKEYGEPDGIHVHIGLKAGMAAWMLKRRYKKKYLVSEQWSGFCPESKPNFNDRSAFFKRLWKLVVRNASGLTAVSKYLGNLIENRFAVEQVEVIPNVVDDSMFFPNPQTIVKPQFIHISSLSYQKYPEQMLEAAAILAKKNPSFTLLIYGNIHDNILKKIRELGLEHIVELKGLAAQEILRTSIQESMALILCSRYETFGCVIIEANACGKPVIVSDIPVFHENVDETTGSFVPLHHPEMLAVQMQQLIERNLSYDDDQIRAWVLSRYSFRVVGNMFTRLYQTHF